MFFNVKIKYIDEGRTSQVQSYQLLHLPAEFQCLPPQAVEFVVCRVKPIDNEIEWNPKVISTRFRMVFPLFLNFSLCVIFYEMTVMNCKLSYQISLIVSNTNKYLLLGQVLRSQISWFCTK